jgi:ATP-binding cassette, subfamily B, multidrug efflux pump
MNYLKRLLPYLKHYRKKLYFGFLVIFLGAIFTNFIPFIISRAIDDIRSNVTMSSLIQYSLLTISFAVFSGVFLYFTRQTIIVVSREIENDLRNDFLIHILDQDQQYFHIHPTGDVMALATNDISAVRNFMGPGIMYTAETLVNFVMAIGLMLSLNFQLTIIAVIPIPVISYVVYRVGKSVNHKFEKVQNQFASLTTRVQENLSGIKVIKSYTREKSEYERFKKMSLDYMDKNLELAKVQSFSFPMMFLLTGISVIIVLYAGGNKIINGDLSLGELTAFIIYLGLLTWPMIAFGWIVNLTQRANASMKRLCDVFDSRAVINDTDITDKSIKEISGSIEFKNMNFKYGESLQYVLKNINLKVEAGETLGIIGHTGSGKTTIVNLLPRLFEITEGSLFIDGIDIKKIPIEVLRKSIGFISQETFLFSDSIEKNISYGLDDIDKDKIIESSKVSRIYNDIDSFPKRFDTILGERGINLSGGQKQRTAIARAIAIEPEILILDDAFSAVDTYTEEEILNGLKNIMKSRTTVLISHRVSTIKNADKIIVLKNGEIAETGTHQSLIQKEGIYADIYFKQLLEEELKKLE